MAVGSMNSLSYLVIVRVTLGLGYKISTLTLPSTKPYPWSRVRVLKGQGQLNNNIDDSIDIHLRMKESIILLLSVKSNFIVYKNNIEPNKYL